MYEIDAIFHVGSASTTDIRSKSKCKDSNALLRLAECGSTLKGKGQRHGKVGLQRVDVKTKLAGNFKHLIL